MANRRCSSAREPPADRTVIRPVSLPAGRPKTPGRHSKGIAKEYPDFPFRLGCPSRPARMGLGTHWGDPFSRLLCATCSSSISSRAQKALSETFSAPPTRPKMSKTNHPRATLPLSLIPPQDPNAPNRDCLTTTTHHHHLTPQNHSQHKRTLPEPLPLVKQKIVSTISRGYPLKPPKSP